ncbi:hypothetical protein ACFCP7_24605 [Paenibacillus elgii]
MIPESLMLKNDEEIYGFIDFFDHGLRVPMTTIQPEEMCQIHFVVAWKKSAEMKRWIGKMSLLGTRWIS